MNKLLITSSSLSSTSQGKMGWLIHLCLIFFFLHSQVTCSSSVSASQLCPESQSYILLQFKSTFLIDDYASSFCITSFPKTVSWKEGTDCCSWDGIICDNITGYVIGLNLSCSKLYGTIQHSNTLFLLSHLQTLNLAHNNFNSTQIPSLFGQFVNLTHLNLSYSWFSGNLPIEISYLSKLVSLDLSNNDQVRLDAHVSKKITQNLTELTELFLDRVNMSSVVPSSLMNLSTSLISLSLTNTRLHGKFPKNIFHLPNLQNLKLYDNELLTGYLPEFNWSSVLKFLDLSYTGFSGYLPGSIGNLKLLNYLFLQHCKYFGSIPVALGNLTQITSLDLSFNNFSGSIPSSLSNLEQLIVLDLSNNNFIGQIPNLFPNLTHLYQLDFSQNQLVGHIPLHESVLPKLAHLSLWDNELNGTIPSLCFALPGLVTLELNNNHLTGNIPDFHSKLLEYIDLSYNMLHGPIPSSIFELGNLSSLMLPSNNFSGNLDLDVFQKSQNLKVLDLSSNSLSLRDSKTANNSTWPMFMILSLSSCNLSEFPSFLRNQEGLYNLDLSNNNIHGQIPIWMPNVGKDTLNILNLSHNFLTSTKPFSQVNLGILDLHSNLLEGPVQILPPDTIFFSVSNNRLTGQIPSGICDIKFLQIIDLSNNSLSGTIPECLGNKYLSVLNLQMNNLTGIIPETFVAGNGLRNLNLNGNQLEGPLPRSLLNCTNLEILDLGNNKINDTFPYWLETLPELQVLNLRSNRFHGYLDCCCICSTRISFQKLRIIDLSYNMFTGKIPRRFFNLKAMVNVDEDQVHYMGEELYQYYVTVVIKGSEIEMKGILTIFNAIDLSNNSFRGTIPEDVGNLKALKGFNISHNELTGHIPSALGNLTNLEWLDLSTNKLGGGIPGELVDLEFLEVLNLSHNQLLGRIPTGKQFDTFQNDSYIGNLGLCGAPLTKKCSGDEPPNQLPPKGGDSESFDEYNWKAILMGYGCGAVFGLLIGYLVLLTRKPQWLLRIVEEPHRKVGGPNHRSRGK